MRLSQTQRQAIKQAARETLGPSTTVYLFGSRTDDSALGGDIDLYIPILPQSPLNTPQTRAQSKIRFLAQLYQKLGEQKIDIVFDPLEPTTAENGQITKPNSAALPSIIRHARQTAQEI